MSCDGSFTTASGRKRTVSTRLKIDVFAPMPSAIETVATKANPGRFRSWRKPKRKSASIVSTHLRCAPSAERIQKLFFAQGNDRVDARRATRRNAARDQCD